MSIPRMTLLILLIMANASVGLHARRWSDSSGHYSLSAEMIAFNDTTVVLQKGNSDLVAVPIEALSSEDQKYLESKTSVLVEAAGGHKVLELESGMKLPGHVVGYDKHPVVIQRRLGHAYVNNRRFEKMSGVYRVIIPRIVEHFTGEQIAGEKGLEEWIKQFNGKPQTFECEGIVIELADGDLYCAPFFLFSSKVREALRPGFERWLAAKDDYEAKERESFLAHAQAEAYRQEQEQMRQIRQLQLNLQAYDAGVFDLWEVAMYPRQGYPGIPLSVVVPARNSDQAGMTAARLNPNYTIGSMRVVPRRY